jgi:hypothetical protein
MGLYFLLGMTTKAGTAKHFRMGMGKIYSTANAVGVGSAARFDLCLQVLLLLYPQKHHCAAFQLHVALFRTHDGAQGGIRRCRQI